VANLGRRPLHFGGGRSDLDRFDGAHTVISVRSRITSEIVTVSSWLSASAPSLRLPQFFDSLAQFYRKAYVRWIDSTKRNLQLRAQRVAEVIGLLGAGVKQRPNR
jgi:hypothetical protein